MNADELIKQAQELNLNANVTASVHIECNGIWGDYPVTPEGTKKWEQDQETWKEIREG